MRRGRWGCDVCWEYDIVWGKFAAVLVPMLVIEINPPNGQSQQVFSVRYSYYIKASPRESIIILQFEDGKPTFLNP